MIHLELEDKEMDYAFMVLSQRPWAEVNPLLVKIQQQVHQQQELAHESRSDQQVFDLRPTVQR